MRLTEPNVYVELRLGRMGILWGRRTVLTGRHELRGVWKLRRTRANLPIELQLGVLGLLHRSG